MPRNSLPPPRVRRARMAHSDVSGRHKLPAMPSNLVKTRGMAAEPRILSRSRSGPDAFIIFHCFRIANFKTYRL